MKTKTNPYQVIIDLKLDADYVSQEGCVELMNEFIKRENDATGLPLHMPGFLSHFIDWIYMNAYEQIDFNKWKRWYTEDTLKAYENDPNPMFEIDTNEYTTQELYGKCKEDFGYWESLNINQKEQK